MTEPKNRLRQIQVDEVSLVDLAANLRRFLVLKRKGGEMSEVDKAIPGPVKQATLRMLTSSLERLMSLVNQLKDMPEGEEAEGAPLPKEVADGISSIRESLAAVGEKYPSPKAGEGGMDDGGDPGDAKPGEGEEEEKAAVIREVIARLDSLVNKQEEPEALRAELEAVAKLLGGEGFSQKPNEGDPAVSKPDLENLPEEVRAQVEKGFADRDAKLEELQKSHEETQKQLSEERDKRELKEMEDYVGATYKNLPNTTPADLAPVLKALKGKAPDELEKLESILKAADEQIAKGGLFQENCPQAGDDDKTPYEKLRSLADELVQKNAGMTPEQARVAVMKTPEGKRLYNEDLAARTAVSLAQ